MTDMMQIDPFLPQPAEVISCRQETRAGIFMLELRFCDPHYHHRYAFHPGQFNMLGLFGVGEVAISIASDPDEEQKITHAIRAVGRVTRALQRLKEKDEIGIRGPFGRGWPLARAQGRDVVIVTGGLGCAPTVSMVDYILARRNQFGRLMILQGVKHSDDFIFKQQYEKWRSSRETTVYVAADRAGPQWPWSTGRVIDMIADLPLSPENTLVMMCGPEVMLHAAIKALVNKGVPAADIYLSMERNMECGVGLCGHCQFGGLFICKDGPVFAYPDIAPLFSVKGF